MASFNSSYYKMYTAKSMPNIVSQSSGEFQQSDLSMPTSKTSEHFYMSYRPWKQTSDQLRIGSGVLVVSYLLKELNGCENACGEFWQMYPFTMYVDQ